MSNVFLGLIEIKKWVNVQVLHLRHMGKMEIYGTVLAVKESHRKLLWSVVWNSDGKARHWLS